MSSKTLYFNGELFDYESLKVFEPERVTMVGAQMYKETVLKAILRYGDFEQVLTPAHAGLSLTSGSESSTSGARGAAPARVPDFCLPYSLRNDSELIFFTPDTALASLARLRRLARRPRAPITGIIHALNYSLQPWIMLQLTCVLQEHDALICSSNAGRTAVKRLLELVRGSLRQDGWAREDVEFETPVIPLGVDVDSFATLDRAAAKASMGFPPGIVFLYFGRFSKFSKADLLPLMITFHRLRAVCPAAVLVLAGDDTQFQLRGLLNQYAADLGEPDRIRIIPNPDYDSKIRLYASADVFVSPADSLQETFGLTVTEAMAAGLPCIVSDWDGYRDLVIDGETGIRIRTLMPDYEDPFDDLRGTGELRSVDLLSATTIVDMGDLTKAMATLAENNEQRCRMGAASRKRAKQLYDWRVVIEAYQRLWSELARKAQSSGMRPEMVSLGDDRVPYKEIFPHYASEILGGRTRVRSTGYSDYGRKLREPGSTWFSEDRFERILDHLKAGASVQVSSVIDDLSGNDPMDRVLTMAHLCRLLKHGIVETAS